MPSSRRAVLEDSDDDDQPKRGRKVAAANLESDVDEDDDDAAAEPTSTQPVVFSSQYPEASQGINPVKANEQSKLFDLSEEKREQAILDLTRTVFFKALAHEAIDRVKCAKEAGVDGKLANAIYEQVNLRLQNAFGFDLQRIPAYMEKIKGLPERYKNRYYLVNTIMDEEGEHHKQIHSVHEQSAKEKALLMVVLAITYCQGNPRSDGSRWILDRDLYALLHQMDDNIPSEPLEVGSRKKRAFTQSSQKTGAAAHQTPDVDACLEMFEKRDYVLRVKASEINTNPDAALDGRFYYSMGPRAVLEIGRRQVIFFCSEILDQEVDPQMLKELDDEEGAAYEA